MNRHLKQGLALGAIGFVLGLGVGLAILFALTSSAERDGLSALDLTLHYLCSGIVGGVAMGFTPVYDIESWSITRCTLTHFVITMGTFMIIAVSIGWVRFDDVSGYITIGCQTSAYFIIWLIMYLKHKRETKELNDDLQRWKQKNKNKENDL
ncbi:MAG: DUF3021 domain-containing protein [Eubacterium sp.]|nr:DUF3021 domain-containing protein [Eubacterium sp.]